MDTSRSKVKLTLDERGEKGDLAQIVGRREGTVAEVYGDGGIMELPKPC